MALGGAISVMVLVYLSLPSTTAILPRRAVNCERDIAERSDPCVESSTNSSQQESRLETASASGAAMIDRRTTTAEVATTTTRAPRLSMRRRFPIRFAIGTSLACDRFILSTVAWSDVFSHRWSLAGLIDDAESVLMWAHDGLGVAHVLQKGVTDFAVITAAGGVREGAVARSQQINDTISAFEECWVSSPGRESRPNVTIELWAASSIVEQQQGENSTAVPRRLLDDGMDTVDGPLVEVVDFSRVGFVPARDGTAVLPKAGVDVVIVERAADASLTAADFAALAKVAKRRIVLLDTAGATCREDAYDATHVPPPPEPTPLVAFLHGTKGEWEEEFGAGSEGGIIVLRRTSAVWPTDYEYMMTRRKTELGPAAPLPADVGPSYIDADAPFAPVQVHIRTVTNAYQRDGGPRHPFQFAGARMTDLLPVASALVDNKEWELAIYGCTPMTTAQWAALSRTLVDDRNANPVTLYHDDGEATCTSPFVAREGLVLRNYFEPTTDRPRARVAVVLTTFLYAHPEHTVGFTNATTVVVLGTTAQPLTEAQRGPYRVDSVLYGGVGLMVLRLGTIDAATDEFGYRRWHLHKVLPALPTTPMSVEDWKEYRRTVSNPESSPNTVAHWVRRATAQEPCANNLRRKLVHLPPPTVEQATPLRLLCVSYTTPSRAERAAAQFEAWGHQCDRFAVFLPFDHSSLDSVRDAPNGRVEIVDVPGGDAYANLWQKTIAIRKMIGAWSDAHTFDFVVWGGDDAFVLTNNLRWYLGSKPIVKALRQERKILNIGLRLFSCCTEGFGSFTQGGMYVLSQSALQMLNNNSRCQEGIFDVCEDQRVSSCLNASGAPDYPIMARDEFGDYLFNMFSPSIAASVMFHHSGIRQGTTEKLFRSAWDYYPLGPVAADGGGTKVVMMGYAPLPVGLNIQSYRGVSLHYIGVDEMRALARLYNANKK